MAEPDLDTDKLDDAALAILSLTLHDGNRVWKGLDWSITDRLHAKGLIHDPVGKAIVGYGVAVITQLVVFPWFGLPARLDDAMAIGAIFAIISILRSFLLRRVFETIRVGGQFRD